MGRLPGRDPEMAVCRRIGKSAVKLSTKYWTVGKKLPEQWCDAIPQTGDESAMSGLCLCWVRQGPAR